MDIFDHYNRAYAAMWAQYVIAEDADEKLPFFVAVEGQANQVQINPAIITSSWGERFTPRWSLRVIDGKAVAFLDAPEYSTGDACGIIAGSCITSYYNGSTLARSTSPMAIATEFARIDQSDNIETYQRAAKSTSSNLYLNQAKAKEVSQETNKMISSLAVASVVEGGPKIGDFNMGTTLQSSATYQYPGNNTELNVSLNFSEAFDETVEVNVEGGGIPESYTVSGTGTPNISIRIPFFQATGPSPSTATLTIKAGQYTRVVNFNHTTTP